MNSSSLDTQDPQARRYTGRVIMGCDTPGPDYLTIQEIEGKRHSRSWDEATEEQYIARCRDKAQNMARDIISQAMAQAQREVEAIREAGRRDMEAAVEAARQETQANLDAEFQAQAQVMAGLMQTVSGVGLEVWRSRRRDFAALAKAFTEKALRVEMDSRRADVLESLMDEALTNLDAHREFLLKVAPQDFELAKTIMAKLQASRPDLGQWRVGADAALAQGGVVLETTDMLADNSLASRLERLAPYLDQLELPEDIHTARETGGQAGEGEPCGS